MVPPNYSIYSASEQLVNGLNYEFIMKLQKVHEEENFESGIYHIQYYTGPFPLKEGEAEIISFHQIKEFDEGKTILLKNDKF